MVLSGKLPLRTANPEHVRVVRGGADAINNWKAENPSQRLSLDGANLTGANLKNADLRGAFLSRANLTASNLSSADLRGAIMAGAILVGTDLSESSLIDANLRSTLIAASVFRAADLTGASFKGAFLLEISSHGIAGVAFADQLISFRHAKNAVLRGAFVSTRTLQFARECGVNVNGVKGFEVTESKVRDRTKTRHDIEAYLGLAIASTVVLTLELPASTDRIEAQLLWQYVIGAELSQDQIRILGIADSASVKIRPHRTVAARVFVAADQFQSFVPSIVLAGAIGFLITNAMAPDFSWVGVLLGSLGMSALNSAAMTCHGSH